MIIKTYAWPNQKWQALGSKGYCHQKKWQIVVKLFTCCCTSSGDPVPWESNSNSEGYTTNWTIEAGLLSSWETEERTREWKSGPSNKQKHQDETFTIYNSPPPLQPPRGQQGRQLTQSSTYTPSATTCTHETSNTVHQKRRRFDSKLVAAIQLVQLILQGKVDCILKKREVKLEYIFCVISCVFSYSAGLTMSHGGGKGGDPPSWTWRHLLVTSSREQTVPGVATWHICQRAMVLFSSHTCSL